MIASVNSEDDSNSDELYLEAPDIQSEDDDVEPKKMTSAEALQIALVLNQRTLKQLHEALMAVSPDVFIDIVTNIIVQSQVQSAPSVNLNTQAEDMVVPAVQAIIAVQRAFGGNLSKAQEKCSEAIVRLGDTDAPLQGAADAHVLLYNASQHAKYYEAWLKKKRRVLHIHKMARLLLTKICNIVVLRIRAQMNSQCSKSEFDMLLNAAFSGISEDEDLMLVLSSQVKMAYHMVTPKDVKFLGTNELERNGNLVKRRKRRKSQQKAGMPIDAANEHEAATSDVATSSGRPLDAAVAADDMAAWHCMEMAWAVNPMAYGSDLHASHGNDFPFEWPTAFSYYANDCSGFPFYHQPHAMLPSILDS